MKAQESRVANAPIAGKLEISARWRQIKTWLNYIIILLSAVEVILAAVHTAQDGGWGITWVFIGPVTGVSVLWSTAELFTQYLARNKLFKRYRGIHPGVHVGMELGLVAGQGTCGSIIMPTRVCNPRTMSPCISQEIEFVVGATALVMCIPHFILFIRACIETHRVRTSYASSVEAVHAAANQGDGDLPEVAQAAGESHVIVPVSILGQGGTTDVYMVTGANGRPQLLAPVGMKLVMVPSEQEQQHVAAAEAGSAQIYELNVPTRVSEMDAR